MVKQTRRNGKGLPVLAKAPSGIQGFDEITGGGLPRGRPSLVTGEAGSGKTLFGMEFLVHGAMEYGEPGLFVSFEENAQELAQNVVSLGFNLAELAKKRLLTVDFVRVEQSEIQETGDYDLEGLFIRLGHAIDEIKAKRIVLDTIEALFAVLPNQQILRAELRRLFGWLKGRGVTAIITAERGDGRFTRHGIEEYVSDCVILLDNRVIDQRSTRRLRVVKYRGSQHGANEYPFLIGRTGLSVLPITSLSLNHTASTGRMPTGIAGLDDMLGGRGLYRGSSVLMSGTAGSGKSSISAHVINAACARNERCLYFPSEESPQQIIRNMRSIGIDLGRWVGRGLLQFHAASPYSHGLETHLALMHRQIVEFDPRVIVMDPMSNLTDIGDPKEVKAMLARLMDFLKGRGITALFTSLTFGSDNPETTEVGVSSMMDTWLLVCNLEANGERTRGLYVLKSRGMAHSNQIREFTLSDQGAKLIDVYRAPAGVVTGRARTIQEARDQAEQVARVKEIDRKRRELERKRVLVEEQITSLRKEIEVESAELETTMAERRSAQSILDDQRTVMAGLSSGYSKQQTNVTRKGISNGPIYGGKRKNRSAPQAK